MFDVITEFIAYIRLFILLIIVTDSLLIINTIVICNSRKGEKNCIKQKFKN